MKTHPFEPKSTQIPRNLLRIRKTDLISVSSRTPHKPVTGPDRENSQNFKNPKNHQNPKSPQFLHFSTFHFFFHFSSPVSSLVHRSSQPPKVHQNHQNPHGQGGKNYINRAFPPLFLIPLFSLFSPTSPAPSVSEPPALATMWSSAQLTSSDLKPPISATLPQGISTQPTPCCSPTPFPGSTTFPELADSSTHRPFSSFEEE